MKTVFDTSKLKLIPIHKRDHDLDLSILKPLEPIKQIHPNFRLVAEKIKAAKMQNAPVVMMIGAHVIRSGVQRYIIDMMANGYLSCIAVNGACIIHDYEFALIGNTTESVERYIKTGQFGFWYETGKINDIVNSAAKAEIGLGQAIGKAIIEGNFPYKDISIFASAYSLKIPITVHVGIGYDITHQHPNCDGAAYGKTSYTDFLIYAKILEGLEGGVVMNFGSAVMAPEIFLKTLSMARNRAMQKGKVIQRFTTLVCDLHSLPEDISKEAPKENYSYYFRPWKTMLIRTVADGGSSYYVKGDHAETIPALWTALNRITSHS